MLCEKCKKNEAKINLVKIVNGQKQQIWLCEECARNISNIPIMGPMGDENIFPFQEIINGILSSVENSSPKKEEPLVCSKCGTTAEEFNKMGKAGCLECYSTFNELIQKKFKEKEKSISYRGKIPKNKGKEFTQKNKLKELKYKLQLLIEEEEYEKAILIRDEIKEIEDNILKQNLKGDDHTVGEDYFNEKLD